MDQKTGTIAIIAIVCAIGSWIATFTGHPIIGILAAVAAVPLGAIGLAMSASPRVSGGLMSLAAIIIGVAGVVVGILGLIGVILF